MMADDEPVPGDEIILKLLQSINTADFQKGLEMLFIKYEGVIRGVMENKLFINVFDEDDVQDIYQEVAERIMGKKIKKMISSFDFNAEGNLGGFIHNITLNVCQENIRKKQNQMRRQVAVDKISRTFSPVRWVERDFDFWKKLRGEVEKLPNLQRNVFVRTVVQGMSHKETAKELDTSVDSVKTAAYLANKKLRIVFRDDYNEYRTHGVFIFWFIQHQVKNRDYYLKYGRKLKDPIAERLGRQIKVARQKASMSRSDLAYQSGLTQADVLALENSLILSNEISSEWINNLSYALKTDLNTIWGGNNKSSSYPQGSKTNGSKSWNYRFLEAFLGISVGIIIMLLGLGSTASSQSPTPVPTNQTLVFATNAPVTSALSAVMPSITPCPTPISQKPCNVTLSIRPDIFGVFCRQGPSKTFIVDPDFGSFVPDESPLVVVGTNPSETWWLVQNPKNNNETCWISHTDEYSNVVVDIHGETSCLDVFDPPTPTPTLTPSNTPPPTETPSPTPLIPQANISSYVEHLSTNPVANLSIPYLDLENYSDATFFAIITSNVLIESVTISTQLTAHQPYPSNWSTPEEMALISDNTYTKRMGAIDFYCGAPTFGYNIVNWKIKVKDILGNFYEQLYTIDFYCTFD